MSELRTERVYVLEAGGTPLVAFEALSRRAADNLRKEPWFTEELASLRSEGKPIWDGGALSVRQGTEDEIIRYRDGAAATKETDELILVYLVSLDG